MNIHTKISFTKNKNENNFKSLFYDNSHSLGLIIPQDIKDFLSKNSTNFSVKTVLPQALAIIHCQIDESKIHEFTLFFNKFESFYCLEFSLDDNPHYRFRSYKPSFFTWDPPLERTQLHYSLYSEQFQEFDIQCTNKLINIDFSPLFNSEPNTLLFSGTENSFIQLFRTLCEQKSIHASFAQNFQQNIVYKKENNSFFATLSLLTKLHHYPADKYNQLLPLVDAALMRSDISRSSNSQQTVKF